MKNPAFQTRSPSLVGRVLLLRRLQKKRGTLVPTSLLEDLVRMLILVRKNEYGHQNYQAHGLSRTELLSWAQLCTDSEGHSGSFTMAPTGWFEASTLSH